MLTVKIVGSSSGSCVEFRFAVGVNAGNCIVQVIDVVLHIIPGHIV